jgi:hypothetical protein
MPDPSIHHLKDAGDLASLSSREFIIISEVHCHTPGTIRALHIDSVLKVVCTSHDLALDRHRSRIGRGDTFGDLLDRSGYRITSKLSPEPIHRNPDDSVVMGISYDDVSIR